MEKGNGKLNLEGLKKELRRVVLAGVGAAALAKDGILDLAKKWVNKGEAVEPEPSPRGSDLGFGHSLRVPRRRRQRRNVLAHAPSHTPKPQRRRMLGHATRNAADAAAMSGALWRNPGSAPLLSPTPRRSKRNTGNPSDASAEASIAIIRCGPALV